MALPVLDATFASSVDLPRRQLLAKWLAEELGETQAPSSVSVSGAGTATVNGIYTLTGEEAGKPYYNLSGSSAADQNAIAWDGESWYIWGSAQETQYGSTDNVAFPWQVTTWTGEDGGPPMPTVTEAPSPSPIAKYYDLPERYLWAKIAVAVGAPKSEADYISLPTRYVWKAIYDAVSGSSLGTIDWSEKQALGHIAAAYRGDTANPEALATYIDWPWRYQVASIIKPAEPVQTTWDLEVVVSSLVADNRFQVALFGTGPNITVDWGDGTSNVYTTTGTKLKTYTTLGKFTVKISGSFAADGRITIPRAGNGLYALSTSIIPIIPNLVSFDSTFSGQNSLGGGFLGSKFGIPENLFINHPNVTSFQNCLRAVNTFGFYFPIPERLFANNPNVTTFQGCFNQCQNLTYIPSGLFSDNPNVTNFRDCFSSCSSLTAIPADLFANNVNVTTFQGCFHQTEITEIPAGLFDNNVAVSTSGFRDCFNSCYSLATIPSDLFANNVNNLNFQSCFRFCEALTTIPSDLFKNNINVTSFSGCFADCVNIHTIPAGLFANNVKATSFSSCFANLSESETYALTNVPVGLFDNNVNATNFANLFYSCYSLTEVPSGLFANNVKVTDFDGTFYNITLTTPSYSNLLINMASNAAARLNSLYFDGGSSKYNTAGAAAQAVLLDKFWTFSDGGPA